MNTKQKKELEKLTRLSYEEMQVKMKSLFKENINLKEEIDELTELADGLDKVAGAAFVFTKSFADTMSNEATKELVKDYIVQNRDDTDMSLTI